MAYKAATFAEIETKLRQDFARRLKESGHASTETNDPILRIFFRTFASQLEALYSDTEKIREALLDELISGLGLERRTARPAQTILRFFAENLDELIPEGTEVVGVAQSQAKLTFATDATIAISSARIAMAATYQNETLQLLPGMEMPDEMQAGHPNPDPVAARLGPTPAIFLAIENLPPQHLSRHSFFFDSSDAQLQKGMRRELWRLADEEGLFRAEGILRPKRKNSGVYSFEWLTEGGTNGLAEGAERPELPDGFYAGRVFVFPQVPPPRDRLLCRCPRGMEQPLARIFREHALLFSTERAWLRISVPSGIADLHTAVHSIALHAISASNIIDLNQTIEFEKQGTSIPIEQPERYLVAPITMLGGEDNAEYLPAFQSSSQAGAGRFAIRNSRVDLIPAVRAGNRPLGKANVPTWVTNGVVGNTVAPGNVTGFVLGGERPSLRINNPMPAAGGTNGESFGDAHARFTHVLLSRSRIVTAADLRSAVRAFDRRIQEARITAALERGEGGLQTLHRVVVYLDREEFQDPDEERRVLREDLEAYLRQRVPFDTEVVVECAWVDEEPPL